MIILLSTFLPLILHCNGDISESINRPAQLNSRARIPTPTQTLLPPTFENPIKDYTVGLLPPPFEVNGPRDRQTPNHIHHKVSNAQSTKTNFINSGRQFLNSIPQQQSGHPIVHQQTHHYTQPQVYQSKTAIYQPFQQFTSHHNQLLSHHHASPKTSYNSASGQSHPVTMVIQPQHHYQQNNFVPVTSHYHVPVTQSRGYQQQHATYTQYPSTSIPVQGVYSPLHTHQLAQKSASVAQPVSSYSSSIIQTYPSVSYGYAPLYGSTLNFGTAKLDPELIRVINDVIGQNHH